MNLPGAANRNLKFRLEDRNGDGVFEMVDLVDKVKDDAIKRLRAQELLRR
jgi:hypothetical protein